MKEPPADALWLRAPPVRVKRAPLHHVPGRAYLRPMLTVAALYHFTRFDDPASLREPLLDLCRAQAITGTLLLAPEGINGTVAGPEAGIAALIAHIRGLPGCLDLGWTRSEAEIRPFARLKIRLKREIVTMGQPQVDPRAGTGRYVTPADWTEFIRRPDVAVIDTRNGYETAIGSFDGAITPETDRFRDFPAWWEANRARLEGKKIAMFCTGGIRCEKSTNYLIGLGMDEVYHLKGGILRYLDEVPEAQSAWRGACFVFDGRVSVGHGLKEGPHLLCHACRRPILPQDRSHPGYEEGVSCHLCHHETSPADKERFRERQKQIALSRQRGVPHLKAEFPEG